MWPWQGGRPHGLQLPVPMLGSQQSLLPPRGGGERVGGAVQISKAGHPQAAGPGALAGGGEQGQRACSLHRHPQPRVYPAASFVLSRGAQKMGLGGRSRKCLLPRGKARQGCAGRRECGPAWRGVPATPGLGLALPRGCACSLRGHRAPPSPLCSSGSEQGGKSPGKPYVRSHDLRVNGSGTSNEEIMPAG